MGILSRPKELFRSSDRYGVFHLDIWTRRLDAAIPSLGLDAETAEVVRSEAIRLRRAGLRWIVPMFWGFGLAGLGLYLGLLLAYVFRDWRWLALTLGLGLWWIAGNRLVRRRPDSWLSLGVAWLAMELVDAESTWRDVSGRRRVLQQLDELTQRAETQAPSAYGVRNAESSLWMRQRFRALATRFRAMQCEAIAPGPDTRESLLASCGQMLAQIVRGDWAALLGEEAQDPPPPTRRAKAERAARRLGSAVVYLGIGAGAGYVATRAGQSDFVRATATLVGSVGLLKLVQLLGADVAGLKQARDLFPHG